MVAALQDHASNQRAGGDSCPEGKVQLDDAGHPIHVKVSRVATFSFSALADWAQDALARGCDVISDGWLASGLWQRWDAFISH
jgi:hypothetical protein